MLVAYILTKQKHLRIKLVRNKEIGVFKKSNFEYRIKRGCIYTKKFLGIKLFFWSMYFEGNPDPIEFDDPDIKVSGIAIDDVALILKKLLSRIYEIIGIIFSVLSLIGVLYLILMLQRNGVI